MSVFASYFWLWSIVGLLCLLMLSTLGAVLNMVGFVTPIKRAMRWADDAPTLVQLGIVILVLGLIAYPSLIHKLWADAMADQTRSQFDSLPKFPSARSAPMTEQMNGLYDPTGTEGTYIIGWYGTGTDFAEVRAYYERELSGRGWVQQPVASAGAAERVLPSASRIQFRDHPDASRSHYELVVAQIPSSTRATLSEIGGEPTIFALRLGVVDPRATTQVSWFIDCLVHRAPTFPTCEAMGWNPLERVLSPRS